jgi:hypothetical protein
MYSVHVVDLTSCTPVHRAIRSENIIAFNSNNSAITKLYLIGFAYTRPGEVVPSGISDLPEGKDWAFYRPPSATRSANPAEDEEDLFDGGFSAQDTTTLSGTTAYDMYGLGIVLLEIGIWAPAYGMVKNGKLETFWAKGLPENVEKLGSRCGAIYRSVVRKCLDPANWGPEDTTENLASVLESLRICRA